MVPRQVEFVGLRWLRWRKEAGGALAVLSVLALTVGGAYGAERSRVDKLGMAAGGSRETVKWEQYPDLNPTGMDVRATLLPVPGVVLADDFQCTSTGSILEIHVFGSWLNDILPGGSQYNVSFTLSMHADIPDPDGPGPGYSKPGPLLWRRTFGPGQFNANEFAGGLMEGWYDPTPPGSYIPVGDHICWEYVFFLTAGEFIQQGTPENPVVYWLDVQATPLGGASFGWKTSMFHWNDDAVWALGEDTGAPMPWGELRYPFGPPPHPWAGQSIDLAFVIMGEDVLGACCCVDLSCVVTTQAACESQAGCMYMGDNTVCGNLEACCHGMGDCDDVYGICCAPILQGTSQGAQTVCTNTTEACCVGGTYPTDCVDAEPMCCDDIHGTESPIGAAACMGDANGNGTNDACEEPAYACCLPDGTCMMTDHMDCVGRGGDPRGPGATCQNTVCAMIKWAQPPVYTPLSPHPECFWGWDELSVYNWGPIVADDFPCMSEQPISDIHWWGSYDNWDGIDPPTTAPSRFHIGIWSDVPAGGNPPFSHPGVLLTQWWVDRTELDERPVACDFHEDFMQAPEGCFRYDFRIPREQWWFQDEACSIYWLSIAPAYMLEEKGDRGIPYMWGWKTRPHLFLNDAAVRIFEPVAPEPGQSYLFGEPILDVQGQPWDTAFVLTTAELNKWEQPPTLTTSGLHAHDWWDDQAGVQRWTRLADQWRCEGGVVTDLHWWGNYENRGSGIHHFHLSIHANDQSCLPLEPALWQADVLFPAVGETDTGWVSATGEPVYFYEYILPQPFVQTEGGVYWFDITAFSNDAHAPALWRWQESSRSTMLSICPAADRGDQSPWNHIVWPGQPVRFSEMAFRITSVPVIPPDPPTPPGGEPGYKKIRYISFMPSSPGVQTAIRVTLTTMPPPFGAFSGQRMWVGEAVTRCENAGMATPPAGGCGASPGLPRTFQTAYMQCAPYCMDYGSVGALHVTDDEIVPLGVYDVQMIECTADFGNEASYSTPLTIRTSKWGDLVKDCTVIPCGPPDGIINVTTDVTSVLDKFKNLPGAVMKSRADLEPNKVEWLVNITDVTQCLDAFLGKTYPPAGWAGPGGCP